MTRLYLVRHGETIWNSQLRFQGHRDVPLSEVGRRQAQHLGERLANTPLAAAYTSDLGRCVETAALVLAGRELTAEVVPALREANFGLWEGLTYEEVRQTFHEEQLARRARPTEVAPTGGELLSDMLLRVKPAIERIVQAHPDQSVLVVSHGGPLRILIGDLLGLGVESYWKIRLDNCSLSMMDTYPQGASISLLNDTCHLNQSPQGVDVP